MTTNRQTEHTSSFNLLIVGLRSRSTTVRELSELAGIDEEEVRAELDQLAALGFVELQGDRIRYEPPQHAIAHRTEELLSNASAVIENFTQETKELLTLTPRLLTSWGEATAPDGDFRTQVFHGSFATTDLWLEIAATRKIRTTSGILPEAHRLFAADREQQLVWFEAIAAEDFYVRTIISSHDATSPGAAEVLAEDMSVGAEFRMMPKPPSWLWIADDDIVGLPFQWGDTWPTSVFATSDPAVVTMAHWLYDRLWNDATPVGSDTKDWDPILALMNQGATLESAAHSLGLSARTGRRRISAALEHFGVDGNFALGAAWQRSRTHD